MSAAEPREVELDEPSKNNEHMHPFLSFERQPSQYASTKQLKRSPLEQAGIWSRMLFLWMDGIFRLGATRQLNEDDLPTLPHAEASTAVTQRMERVWLTEKRRIRQEARAAGEDPDQAVKTKLTIGLVIRRTFSYHFWWGGVLKFINDVLGFVVPIQLNYLLRFMEDEDGEDWPTWSGYALALSLVLFGVFKTLAENQFFFQMTRISVQLNGGVAGFVHNKGLRLSSSARGQSTTGEIVNLMQLDAARLSILVFQLHILWSGAFQIIGYTAQLFFYLGPSAAAGILSMPLFIALQGYFMRMLGLLRQKQVKAGDERVKQTNEILQGIKAIKQYAWESAFVGRVNAIREKAEMVFREQAAIYSSGNMAMIGAAPTLILCITFVFYTAVAGEKMVASRVFTAISVFERLRFPLIFYPMVLGQWVEAKVALQRLTRYMHLDEVETEDQVSAASLRAIGGARGTLKSSSGASIVDGSETSDNEDDHAVAANSKQIVQFNSPSSAAIEIRNADFDWSVGLPALRDIDVSIPKGDLTAIVGPVASGKTAMVMAMLRELKLRRGTLRVEGTVALVTQSAWIQNATVRDNILFGVPYDKTRYDDVVEACCLRTDLDLLPKGDQTEIGERGINLSGGQKQRVAIARAAYHDCDVYIFDDPLSALDSEVARNVFDRCIVRLLGQKTRVMVTNQLHFLSHTDKVIVMKGVPIEEQLAVNGTAAASASDPADTQENGAVSTKETNASGTAAKGKETQTSTVQKTSAEVSKKSRAKGEKGQGEDSESEKERFVGHIEEQGTFQQLIAAGLDFASLMERHGVESDEEEEEEEENQFAVIAQEEKEDSQTERKVMPDLDTGDRDSGSVISRERSASTSKRHAKKELSVSKHKAQQQGGDLIGVEEREIGVVRFNVYRNYVESATHGMWRLFAVMFCVVGAQAMNFIASFWISEWAQRSEEEDTADPDPGLLFYLGLYSVFGITFAIFSFYRMFFIYKLGVSSSLTLHRRLLDSIMRATPAFFDTTPLGRILARFSKDLDQIDNFLANNLSMLLFTGSQVITTIIVLSYFTWYFALLVPPLAYVYVQIMDFFRASNRELKRLDSVSRSPVYAHFSAMLGGLSTIRAFHAEKRFVSLNEENLDRSNRAYFVLKMADRWLALRLEFMGLAVLLGASVFIVMQRGNIFAGLAGVSLNYALSVTQLLGWTVRTFAELEAQMNSVERVMHYTTQVEQEADPEGDDPKQLDPPKGWPNKGAIEFSKFQVRYRPGLPLVLQGMTASIKAGEKVAFVGRTGAGKSTIMLSLLRMLESAGGSLKIDGVDIASIKLPALRTQVSIIPQDPLLFSGTVRFNLDPAEQLSDKQLSNALERVGLNAIELDDVVEEHGENFSQGQRQLICLARALLRQSPILLMDEATSSVDFETDQLVQRVIREDFADRTILTIAHRLNTIIDNDRVLVMDKGTVAEFDHPAVLLRRRESLFYKMVEQTGNASAKVLRAEAEKAYRKTHQEDIQEEMSEPTEDTAQANTATDE